jgi:RNA-directed DNA polymerase
MNAQTKPTAARRLFFTCRWVMRMLRPEALVTGADPANAFNARALTSRLSQQPPRNVLIRLNQIMRGWSNYFRHAVAKHTMSSPENFVWHRVIRWFRKLHRWRWRDVRQHHTCLHGRSTRPSADGIELFNHAKVRITRYRYRGTKIPNSWGLANHA